ncbi:Hypp8973 [Branchiostoma lanceolatum]|uniref:Hypp8973 protein n=1 Tax=Branchiostoma lanceolatum TaxID=7740 RepID=A0A8J9ZBR1_BRALA|nr:Hypp8973 [Branchiostoma lanceolatum]
MPSQVARGRNHSNKDDLDRAFDIVESEVKTSWKIVAMELGQTVDEILVFEKQSLKVPDQCRRSLDWWRLMAGPKGATVPNLVQALRRCRLDWVADKIEGRSPIRVLEKKTIPFKPERIAPVTEDSHSRPIQPATATLGGVQFLKVDKEVSTPEQSPASTPAHETSSSSSAVEEKSVQVENHSPTFIIVKKKTKTRKEKKSSKSEQKKSKVTISDQVQTRPSEQPLQAATHYTQLQRSENIRSSAFTAPTKKKAASDRVLTRPKSSEKPPKVTISNSPVQQSESIHSSAPMRSHTSTAPSKKVISDEAKTRRSEEPPKVTTHKTQLQRSETIHSSAPARSHAGTAPPKLPVPPPRTKQTRHSRYLEHRAKPRERTIDGIKNYQRIPTHSQKKPVQEITDWTKAHSQKKPVERTTDWTRTHSQKKLVEEITDWTRVTIHPPEKKSERRKERPKSQSSIVRIVPSTPLSSQEGDFLYWERPSKEKGPVIPVLLPKLHSIEEDSSSVQQNITQEDVPDTRRSPKSPQQNGDAKAPTSRQAKVRETTPPVPPRRKRSRSSRRASPMYLNNEQESSDDSTRRGNEYSRRNSFKNIVLDRETDRVDEDPLPVRPSIETVRRQMRERRRTSQKSEVQTENDVKEDRIGRRRARSAPEEIHRVSSERATLSQSSVRSERSTEVITDALPQNRREVAIDRDVEEENRQNLDTEAVQESHRYDNLLLVGGTRQPLPQQQRRATEADAYENQTVENTLNVNQEQMLQERFTESRLSERNIAEETREPTPPLQLHWAEIVKEELIIYYPLDEFETDSNYSASLDNEPTWQYEEAASVSPPGEPVFHTADILREEMVIYVPEEELEAIDEHSDEVQSTTNTRYDDDIPLMNAGRFFGGYVNNHTRSDESDDHYTRSYVSSVNVRRETELRASQRADYVNMSRKPSRDSTGESQNGGSRAGFFTQVLRKPRAGSNDDVFEDGRFRRVSLQKKTASVARDDSLRKKTVSFSEQPIVIPSDDNQEDGDVGNYHNDAMLW